jgi:hypothetical protein
MVTDGEGQYRRKPRKPIARDWRLTPAEPFPVVVIRDGERTELSALGAD